MKLHTSNFVFRYWLILAADPLRWLSTIIFTLWSYLLILLPGTRDEFFSDDEGFFVSTFVTLSLAIVRILLPALGWIGGFFFLGICCWWPLTITHWIYLDSLVLNEVSQQCEAIWRHAGLFSCHCWYHRRFLPFVEAVYYWNPFTTSCCHFGVTHFLWMSRWPFFKGLCIIIIRVWFNPPHALGCRICKQFLLKKLVVHLNRNKFIWSFF